MKNQKSKIEIHKYGIFLLISFLLVTCILSFVTSAEAEEWGGVDESVVEKYAEEQGRSARDPIINTNQGDLLLFVFLLAGAAGGFATGYCWRSLTASSKRTDVQSS